MCCHVNVERRDPSRTDRHSSPGPFTGSSLLAGMDSERHCEYRLGVLEHQQVFGSLAQVCAEEVALAVAGPLQTARTGCIQVGKGPQSAASGTSTRAVHRP